MSKTEASPKAALLPADLWRQIASKDPAVCLSLTRVSKETPAATAEMAKLASRMHPDQVGRIQRIQAQRRAAKKTGVVNARLIPGVGEASPFTFDNLTFQPNLVQWTALTTAHLALSPVVLPIHIGCRLARRRDNLKDSKIAIAQRRDELFKSIAADAQWLGAAK